MSAIGRKVEWLKLRELRLDEQELIRKRYHYHGKRFNTQKVQVVYTDGRIDSHHAPDCAFPNEEAVRHYLTLPDSLADDMKPYSEWAGKPLQREIDLATNFAHVYVPAPCTCGIIQQEEPDTIVIDSLTAMFDRPNPTVDKFVRPYLGLYATRGTPKYKGKKEMPTLIRFVPRPLTLEAALEFGEVDDLQIARVAADTLLHRGHPRGEILAKLIHKSATALAVLMLVLTSCGAPVESIPAPSCPTSPSTSTRCCASESAEVRCVSGVVWYCDSLHRDDAGVLEFMYWQKLDGETCR